MKNLILNIKAVLFINMVVFNYAFSSTCSPETIKTKVQNKLNSLSKLNSAINLSNPTPSQTNQFSQITWSLTVTFEDLATDAYLVSCSPSRNSRLQPSQINTTHQARAPIIHRTWERFCEEPEAPWCGELPLVEFCGSEDPESEIIKSLPVLPKIL